MNNNFILSPSAKKTWNKLISFKNSLKKSQLIEANNQCKYASISRTNKIKTSTIKKTKEIENLSNHYCLSIYNGDKKNQSLVEIDQTQQIKLAMISTLEHELSVIEKETMAKFSSKSSLVSIDSGFCVDISMENFHESENSYVMSKSETLV